MLSNGDVFAGYVIERQLGRGGMGSVYLAKHPRLPRMTALKLLNREMVFDKEVRARFEREADLVAQLDHHNIVTVYDRGLEDGQLWISMQYIDGIDAASVNPQTLPPERAVQIVAEMADALDYAHRNEVLHRDVKPANILLARSTGGKGERVYLTDFGIARLRDDSGHLTQTGTFTATLAYASPEQLTGSALDGRSDQYSLACTLFWLFTGSGPFSATNPAAVIQGHLQNPPPPLSGSRSGLPPSLDLVIAKAMAKRPEDRFANCSDFAAAARRALAHPSAPAMPLVQRTAPPMPVMPHTAGPTQVATPMTSGAMPTGMPMYTSGAMPMGGPMQTGGPLPTGMPMTGAPMPTAGPRPHTAPPSPAVPYPASTQVNSVPPKPVTGNYTGHGTAQYTQSSSYAYASPGQQRPPVAAPRPTPPNKSNTGLIVGIVLAAVVLLIVVIVVVAAAGSKAGGKTKAAPSVVTTAGAAPADDKQIDWSVAAQEFPKLLPAVKTGGKGFNGATCWVADSPVSTDATDGTPDFGDWEVQWRCYGGGNNNDPFYRIFAYSSAADAQSVLSDLTPDAKSQDANGGKTYTNYQITNDSHPRLVTAFTGDNNRTQYLMYTDGLTGSIDPVLKWWKNAPLN
ncbi:protein kinase domain-containing protein [Nocardia aurantiaca]|uniref:non-specific serine/threonine protein kinase n=1 Tax=Nocardia aurantiaca TaxID=2675850 RepID=A0A6I3KTD7_9NOCA|nr:protein kinase [Nocardia aurantiaca]MTE12817.1 protein kinase [Nocardia aurantiaca]